MDYLEELVDRTWRIGWSAVPLVLLAVLIVRRGRSRPAVVHAVALGAALVLVLPLVLPLRRHVFELPGAADASTGPWLFAWLTGGFPAPWWLAAVLAAFLLARHVRQACAFRKRLAACERVPSEVERAVERLAREVGLNRPPRASWSDGEHGPLVLWGPRQGRLFLPREQWEGWSAQQREVVLLHELAHLRRRDGLTQLASTLVTVVYWWNPLSWWLRAVSHEAAEKSCDRWATALRGDARKTYARLLLSLAADRSCSTLAAGVNAAIAGKRRLARRLQSILCERRAPSSAWRVVVTTLAIVFAGGALTVGQLGALETRHTLLTVTDVQAFLTSEPDAPASPASREDAPPLSANGSRHQRTIWSLT